MWKIVAGRQLELEEADELLREKKVGPLQGFKSRLGRPFAALIKLTAEFKPEFDFGPGSGGENGQAAVVDFSGLEPIGICPKCKSKVYDTGMAYVCEKAVGPNRTCDFRSGKIILQREIPKEQMVKLLTTGKTDLLQKFISKKGRPFNAYLALDKTGKTAFEFEPRKPKVPGAKGKAKGGVTEGTESTEGAAAKGETATAPKAESTQGPKAETKSRPPKASGTPKG